ncbi:MULTISPECIES: PAAR domain-containing protein [Cupriavidus]|uniref:PAAR domain-containing protein n=1 Tax=Cupriavidus TaxID=106589 RepID=UPI001F2C5FBA|nr:MULTISPECIES: PAAR domain-containing protein [Cupriavidus]
MIPTADFGSMVFGKPAVSNRGSMMQDRKTKKIYVAAFEGAKTANGGEVVKGSGNQSYDGRPIVRVGDVATYQDGSTAVIMAGAGKACESAGVPVALIGSPLSNGDTIVFSPVTALEFHESADKSILGLLDPAYYSVRA